MHTNSPAIGAQGQGVTQATIVGALAFEEIGAQEVPHCGR